MCRIVNECRRADITPFGQNHHVTAQRSTGKISHKITGVGPSRTWPTGLDTMSNEAARKNHVRVEEALRKTLNDQQHGWVEGALRNTLTDPQQAENISVHVITNQNSMTATTHSHGLTTINGNQMSMRLILEAILALGTIARDIVEEHASRTTVTKESGLESAAAV